MPHKVYEDSLSSSLLYQWRCIGVSKRKSGAQAMLPGPEAGEEFMAVMLWAQTSSCTCPACNFLRDMAGRLVKTHVKEAKPGE